METKVSMDERALEWKLLEFNFSRLAIAGRAVSAAPAKVG